MRWFAGKQGTPVLIVSDNAKTFKAANKTLEKLYNHPEVTQELLSKKIEWKFNLERARVGWVFLKNGQMCKMSFEEGVR